MSSGTYCKFCHHYWKNRKEYDRHLSCCEYFHHQRRNPPAEMNDRGGRLPTMAEMYRLVENLTHRLEKTEKEVQRLRTNMNTRQKKAIIEWLNQPSQIPQITFEDWWHEIKANESDVQKVVNGDLTKGMLSCIESHLQQFATRTSPIRCFSQKANTFYVYSIETNKPVANDATVSPKPMWQIMSASQLEKMCAHIVQQIIREFLVWQNTHITTSTEYDERAMDKRASLLMKIHGYGVSNDKRMSDIKKLLFPQMEENLRVIMDCEFE